MNKHRDFIYSSIFRDMSEGLLIIDMGGKITQINPAAEMILERSADELLGQSFALSFFQYAENDAFNQVLLDAVYERDKTHEAYVPYYTGKTFKQIHITTSYLMDGEEKIAEIAVLSDVTELSELRDAMKAAAKIRELNERLSLRNALLHETFGRYLSDEIVRQILDTPNGLALGGKKEEITIMMSDLRGFTALSERMDAENLLVMLNRYFERMTAIIQKYNGTIIEFLGDGIFAIFGKPIPTENHAEAGLAAAIEMQAAMPDINRQNEISGFPMIEMGIGLNSGEAIVGNIGSEKRTKYGVMGANVNLCGRIESYTVGGQILVSPTTLSRLKAAPMIEKEMAVMPKGVNDPIVISQVTGLGAPYHLSCKTKSEYPEPLAETVEVRFRLISDKHVSEESFCGTLIALGQNGAILETTAPIKTLDNLQIDIGGDLFAKVLSREKDAWLLRFTAKPPQWESRLEIYLHQNEK